MSLTVTKLVQPDLVEGVGAQTGESLNSIP